jgi:hypothetical protein
MKRLLALLIIAVLAITPFASFSKIAITDEELDAVQAEAGVSIVFTNVTVGGTTNLSSISWGDPSGFTGYTAPGYFGFEGWTVTGNLAEINGGTMNIDIGYNSTANSTRVNILLPTITLGGAAGMTVSAWMKADTAANLISSNATEAGIITIRGFSTQVSGSVTLYAH